MAITALPEASVDAVVTDPPYSSGGWTRDDKSQDARDKCLAAYTAP